MSQESENAFLKFIDMERARVAQIEILKVERANLESAIARSKKLSNTLGLKSIREKIAFVKSDCTKQYKALADAEQELEKYKRLSTEAWSEYEKARGL